MQQQEQPQQPQDQQPVEVQQHQEDNQQVTMTTTPLHSNRNVENVNGYIHTVVIIRMIEFVRPKSVLAWSSPHG